MSSTTQKVVSGTTGAKGQNARPVSTTTSTTAPGALANKLREMSARAQATSDAEREASFQKFNNLREQVVADLTQEILEALENPDMVVQMENVANATPPRTSCFLNLSHEMLKPMREGPNPMYEELTHVVSDDGKTRVSYVEALEGPRSNSKGEQRTIPNGSALYRVNQHLKDTGLYVAVEHRPSRDHQYRLAKKEHNGEYVWIFNRNNEPVVKFGERLQLVVTWDRREYEKRQAEFHARREQERAQRQGPQGPRAPRAEDFVPRGGNRFR
jgi:hypothetical protein